MAYVTPHKGRWKKRDGPSHVPASVVWRVKEGLNSSSPESVAHQTGKNLHWKEEGDGPPEIVAHQIGSDLNGKERYRAPEAVARQTGRNLHWKERNGPSLVSKSVAGGPSEDLNSRSPETIAHPIGRSQQWKERDGLSCVPASVAWQPREGLNSRSPKTIAHQIGRSEHLKERDGLSCVPASVAWQPGEGLNSGSPITFAHQIERNRHWKEKDGPSCVPATVARRFKEGLNLGSAKPIAHQSWRIEYAAAVIFRWLPVGWDDHGDYLPCTVFVRPVSVEPVEWQPGEKLLALAKSCVVNEGDEMGRDQRMKPWVHIAETVMQDLVCSFKALRREIKDKGMDGIKPTVIARLGKILFLGNTALPVETCGDVVTFTQATLKRLRKSFDANLPSSYMENLTYKVIPEIGLSFKEKKDIYHVKLCDTTSPGVTICCKCNVIEEEKRIEVYKVELGQMRHMVVDVSCLNKDLDVRLMLRAKRLFTAISEDEKSSIKDLIASAILDSSVKGGLRWPLRKSFSGDRYRVIGSWHTISTTYNNSTMRLKLKHADRFDFRCSHGEATEEVMLKLKGITSELHGQCLETDSICDMLKDAVKMMWEHFLSCGDAVI